MQGNHTHLERLHPLVVAGVDGNEDGRLGRLPTATQEEGRAVEGLPVDDQGEGGLGEELLPLGLGEREGERRRETERERERGRDRERGRETEQEGERHC